MGVAPYVAEAIVREHAHRPLHGEVILLGRQTMMFTPDDAERMIRAAGANPVALPVGEDIIDRDTDLSRGREWIRDDAFLRMLGAARVRAIDHTAYEGADIVHDLNQPVPLELEGSADFIIDGSTLDNVFNPAACLQNIARMLRPGGRLISVNVGSPHQGPYTVMTPYWLLDFFAVNDFADCRIYMTLHGRRGELSVFAVDAADESGPSFLAPQQIGIVAFAEKGPQSTSDRYPVQRIYCDEAMMAQYRAAAQRFAASGRPEVLVSYRPLPLQLSLLQAISEHYRMVRLIAAHFPLVAADGARHRTELPRLPFMIGRKLERFMRVR
jgi:SAM-dependent methyltransferase